MTEHYTFPNSATALPLIIRTTLSLRRAGFKTRLVERQLTAHTVVQTVVATPPTRPTRRERCTLNTR